MLQLYISYNKIQVKKARKSLDNAYSIVNRYCDINKKSLHSMHDYDISKTWEEEVFPQVKNIPLYYGGYNMVKNYFFNTAKELKA